MHADEKLRRARAEVVVLLSPNTLVPGPEVEDELLAWRNGGLSTYVVGWRRAREGEMARGWRGAWSGDLDELDGLGQPWWMRDQAYGIPAAAVAPERMMDDYAAAYAAGEATRPA